jgi:hypothetical protein
MLGDVGHFGELGFCASAMDQICSAQHAPEGGQRFSVSKLHHGLSLRELFA